MNPPMPAMSGCHPGLPWPLQQQFYFGEEPELMIPQHTGFGFQQQFNPGIHPGVATNFMMPYHLQMHGQPGQQFHHWNANKNFRYMQNSCNVVDPMRPALFESYNINNPPADAAPRPMTTSGLASALASTDPEQRKSMLGEILYPCVEQIQRDYVRKVTGMLLEMDNPDVIHLIEAPDALRKKVGEAMEVLRSTRTTGSDAEDQLVSIGLK